VDTLTSIRVFRQVVDSGSFTRAAKRLDMSTATVSKHVMHVERRLGVRLLNRNSRSLSLTEPGKLYFDRCKTILEDLQAAELELGSLVSVPRGTLRVSVPSSASGRWLADLLAQYRCRYPEVLVDLSFEDRHVNLVDEGYDLALRITSRQHSLPAGLVARPLRPAVFCLAASREYVERRGAPRCPEDLREHDFVEVGDMLNFLLRPAGVEKQEIPLNVVLRYRSMNGVANAVAAGLGIAPVPAVLFGEPAFRDVLTPILPAYPLQRATLYVVYATRKFVPLKLRTFVDFTVEFLSLDGEPKPPRFRAIKPVLGLPFTSAAEPRVRGKALGSLIT
jgi:DNA-binding transcriptional LysR family regulator